MRRTLISLFFVFLVSAALAAGRPWEKYLTGKNVRISIPELQSTVLPGGATLYFMKDSMLPQFSFTLILDGGVFEEPDEKRGLTALWSDTLTLSGSDLYPTQKLAAILEKEAASFSASSSLERTRFQISGLTPFLETGLKMMFQILKNPRFAAEDFELLRKQTLQGISRRAENPGGVAMIGAERIFLKGTVRSRLTTADSIKAITAEDLRGWHKRMLAGARMSFLVTGDFSVETVRALIEKEFSGLPAGRKPETKILEAAGEPFVPGSLHYYVKDVPQSTIVMKAPGISHSSPDYFALKVYNMILGGDAFNSRLMQEVRVKQGWAYTIYSAYDAGLYPGDVSIFTQSANKNIPDVLRKIREILAAPEKFISPERVEEAKQSLINQFVFLYETLDQLAGQHLAIRYDGLPADYLKKFPENIARVTPEDVLRIARSYYSPEKFFHVIVGPEKVWGDFKDMAGAPLPFSVPM